MRRWTINRFYSGERTASRRYLEITRYIRSFVLRHELKQEIRLFGIFGVVVKRHLGDHGKGEVNRIEMVCEGAR